MTMSTTASSPMPAEYGFREADDPQGKRVIITPRPYGGAVTDLLFWARRAGADPGAWSATPRRRVASRCGRLGCRDGFSASASPVQPGLHAMS
ncbi:hypothetical protein OOZ63_11275 [Paucibacter sp. PLA-PC-4]|uniref:hypothetical protein n=1 Tax=Paucibacter sp. PLA-PC-4 TaxID=2993655 RepID=UPI0022498F1F|nr:hypothetical protein [Paucibacter sp. PLA-PC-4]MCX2862422.1 hypothetical protein [Paucibacter sp. PLA-PC-4]